MQTINMGTKNLPAGLVKEELHDAITIKLCQCFGIGLEIAAYGSQGEIVLFSKSLGVSFR